MRRKGFELEAILAALHLENEAKFDPPLPDKEVEIIAKSVCRYEPSADDFARNQNNKVLENNQDNIRLALFKMKILVRYNEFTTQHLLQYDGLPEVVLDDAACTKLWLEIDDTFHFRPALDFFTKVMMNEARKNPFHPVREFLDSLEWDGVKRLDDWLIKYAEASDNDYVRAIGKIVMVAACRRIRTPGCKFDELMILESPQGTNKSTFLNLLAMEDAWFTDDLPLTAESKEVIERTAGKWIVEAAELSGMKKNDIETLKSFLSRKCEVARLSYDRMTSERPRHFIVIGTTNSQYYLKDTTGNRRFWPVRVKGFNLEAIKRDRTQLWAEAAQLETEGVSIRLDPNLWALAAKAQEKRRVDDPWEQVVTTTLGDIQGRIKVEDVWQIVQVPINRRTQFENERIGEVMKRLGFERHQAGVVVDGVKKIRWTYQRGDAEQRKNWIALEFDECTKEVQAVLKDQQEKEGLP